MAETESQKYEKLARDVIDRLAATKGIQNSKVKWNRRLNSRYRKPNGKPFKHQIDVLWEFELDDKQHRVAFECKSWTRPVDFTNLIRFVGVMSDLEDDVKGIIVTRTGYDISVEEYARVRGIGMIILDEAGSADFLSGIIPEISITATQNTIQTQFLGMEFEPATAFEGVQDVFASTKLELQLLKKDGKPLGSLGDLLQQQYKWAADNGKLGDKQPVSTHFVLPGKEVFIQTNDGAVVQVMHVYSQLLDKQTDLGGYVTTINRVLQFLVEDELYFVDSDGEIHKDQISKEYSFEADYDGQPIQLRFGLNLPLRGRKRPPRPPKN